MTCAFRYRCRIQVGSVQVTRCLQVLRNPNLTANKLPPRVGLQFTSATADVSRVNYPGAGQASLWMILYRNVETRDTLRSSNLIAVLSKNGENLVRPLRCRNVGNREQTTLQHQYSVDECGSVCLCMMYTSKRWTWRHN